MTCKCSNWQTEAHLLNELWQSKRRSHVTAVYRDGLFPVYPRVRQHGGRQQQQGIIRGDEDEETKIFLALIHENNYQNITDPFPHISLPSYWLPGRLLGDQAYETIYTVTSGASRPHLCQYTALTAGKHRKKPIITE